MRRGYAIQPMDSPAVTVVVPTRGRAAYLEVTLESLRRQRTRTPHELLVVDDGATDATPQVAERDGVRLIRHGERRSLNAARNTGLREAAAPLVAFVDDDVLVPPGWLDALVEGAERHPDAEAFGGPIRARFEGHVPRGCGREDPPITTLDLGSQDVEAEMVWGANFAVRRSAVERVGEFDESLDRAHGDEEDWLLRLRAAGGRIVYLADAGLDHRRSAGDSGLGSLARAAYHRGRGARSSDLRRGQAPALGHELRVLAGCGWHTRAARLPTGSDPGRALGRSRDGGAASEMSSTRPDPDTFLAGDAGDVTDPWRSTKRRLGELAYGALDTLSGTRRRAARLARSATPQRDVLVIGVYRPGSLLAEALPALLSERHRVRIALGSTGPADEPLREHTVAENLDGGKFENLNRLLEAAGAETPDWTICDRRRRAGAARLPRPLRRRVRGVRARPGTARADAAQPFGLEGHAAAAGHARARDPLRRDRPGHGVRARSRRRAAAVPRAPLRLGARPPLGRACRGARLAAGRGRRAARAPRVRCRGRGLRAGGRRGGGGALPRRAPLPAERARRATSWPCTEG